MRRAGPAGHGRALADHVHDLTRWHLHGRPLGLERRPDSLIPKPVHAELVEALSFASCLTRNPLKEKQSFDKLRTGGVGGEVIHISHALF